VSIDNEKQKYRSWAKDVRCSFKGGSDIDDLTKFLQASVISQDWVVIYWPLSGELDIRGLAESIPNLALTRTDSASSDLTIHPFDSEMEMGKFGVIQPVSKSRVVEDSQIGAVCVPGLVFDQRGYRIGFGKGFYDRFLSRLGSGVLRVGVVSHSTLLVAELPKDSHDVRMSHIFCDGVVTDVSQRHRG
jgi:5,10-methenyltetrahydrofolate synthetase